MTNYIEISFTCGSLEEGREICRGLVEEGLVACAQMIPNVESIYIWEGKLQQDQECKAILKTTKNQWESVERKILEKHSYDTPEITWRTIDGGNQEYLAWLGQSVLKSKNP